MALPVLYLASPTCAVTLNIALTDGPRNGPGIGVVFGSKLTRLYFVMILPLSL